jgi:arylformamidase
MLHIVDLSHRLQPGKQRFKLEIKPSPVEEWVPEYKVPTGEWYIMEDLEVCTHVGTHVESPYHALRDGKHIADMDLRKLIGEAVVVDFSDKGYQDAITRQEIEKRGENIRQSDIVLIRTGLSRYYGTPQYLRPYVETEAIEWLIRRQIKCLGIDCSGIENRAAASHEINHRTLFNNDIPLIEDMNNLDKLKETRVFFIALTLPIEGLDASLIRPIAIEPLEAIRPFAEILSEEAVWEGL